MKEKKQQIRHQNLRRQKTDQSVVTNPVYLRKQKPKPGPRDNKMRIHSFTGQKNWGTEGTKYLREWGWEAGLNRKIGWDFQRNRGPAVLITEPSTMQASIRSCHSRKSGLLCRDRPEKVLDFRTPFWGAECNVHWKQKEKGKLIQEAVQVQVPIFPGRIFENSQLGNGFRHCIFGVIQQND